MSLTRSVQEHEDRLANCVHCGFCLPVCPTYRRLGDEADSPRGRLYFMRAVVERRLDAGAEAFRTHIDRCLGCRACETVCPSGVEYGYLLEEAREATSERHPLSLSTRLALAIFLRPALLRLTLLALRLIRSTPVPGLAARLLPARGFLRQVRLGLGMLASSAPPGLPDGREQMAMDGPVAVARGGGESSGDGTSLAEARRVERVTLLRGCVQGGLFGRVNEATGRVLEANGYRVEWPRGQVCCGALHAHAGSLSAARSLARRNIDVFRGTDADWIGVNAAGCGATMKEYGRLLAGDPEYRERAGRFAERVRDISELIADRGPRCGGTLPLRVAYDAPCHLLHAQGVAEPPLEMLRAIPGLVLVPLERADECCGGAGLWGATHAELGSWIGLDKIRDIEGSGADAVATPNPGCMMQIGAWAQIEGLDVGVWHPAELLDLSYLLGGVYQGGA